SKIGYPINPDLPSSEIILSVAGVPLVINSPIQHRVVDPVKGEVYAYLAVTPPITASIKANHLVKNGETKTVEISFTNNTETKKTANIAVNLEGNNWRVTPNALSLTFSEKNQTITKTVQVENLSTESTDNTTLQLSYEGQELL